MRALGPINNATLLAAAVFAVSTVVPRHVRACSCLQPTVKSSYNNSSDVVFVHVVRVYKTHDRRWYKARVLRTFKGCLQRGDTVVLTTPASSAACGVELRRGRYLINGHSVVSYHGLSVLSIGLCDYNVELSDLTPDDRAFLEGRTVCCGDTCTCADGSEPVQCLVDPCSVAPACEEGSCHANYCGGCHAEFYDESGYAVCQENKPCETDADCGDGEWCRQAAPVNDSDTTIRYECVPFVGVGETCEGSTTPWFFERCAAGLTCDARDFRFGSAGICRTSCENDSDCSDDDYCAADHLCDRDGECEYDVDCNLAGNTYPHIDCVGHGVCSVDGQCGWQCGDRSCIDLAGYDFGSCETPLGWAIVLHGCVQVTGCSSGPFPLFSSAEQCEAACLPSCDGQVCPQECQSDADCMPTGCSGQICSAQQVTTTCEFRPEYACYQDATIAQCGCSAGRCGWAQTDALQECLDNAGGSEQ